MLANRLLRGVPVTRFGGAPGVFVAPHGREPGAFRYLASHADGEAHKARILPLLARQRGPEPADAWDFHPLVEPEDVADVDFDGTLAPRLDDELPCVLMPAPERRAFLRALHGDGPDAPIAEVAAPATPAARARAVAQRARLARSAHADPRRHSALRARVRELATRYRDAYADDRVLQRLAQNLFDDAMALLR